MTEPLTLHLDADELAACVSCGLCLPHCPTYRVSGDEALSPRGRIAGMRAISEGAPLTAGFLRSVDTCVQCRACETACPSQVQFGHLMEGTRTEVARAKPRRVWRLRAALALVTRHRVLLVLSSVLALLQRAHLAPRRLLARFGIPADLPVRRPRLAATGDDVWLFTGCVMDAWQRHVHADAIAVLRAMGTGVALSTEDPCCGALHEHAGLRDVAARHAARTIQSLPGGAPILVDSAGCGAAMKDYGRLLSTPEAIAFAARVRDVHEWLAEHRDRLPAAARHLGRIAVQDPCHLRHVQRIEATVRDVLAPYADIVELDDDGMCCGAGGAYTVVQPRLAGDIRDRKVAAIARTGAPIVASANPGCAVHLSAAGLDVRHPVELIAEASDTRERVRGR